LKRRQFTRSGNARIVQERRFATLGETNIETTNRCRFVQT
jgi:hypothetical protein